MKARRSILTLAAVGTLVGFAFGSSPAVPAGAHTGPKSETLVSNDKCASNAAPAAEVGTDGALRR